MRQNQSRDLATTVFDLIDAVVEVYLKNIIRPFLSLHEVFYSGLNKVLRQVLDDHKKKIPTWFTANFITYARTWLVFPTILLLAWGHYLLPAILVILVDLGDFLDGVVARFWNKIKKEKEANEEKDRSRSNSPTNSDKDSFGKLQRSIDRLLSSSCIRTRNCLFRSVLDYPCRLLTWFFRAHFVYFTICVCSFKSIKRL